MIKFTLAFSALFQEPSKPINLVCDMTQFHYVAKRNESWEKSKLLSFKTSFESPPTALQNSLKSSEDRVNNSNQISYKYKDTKHDAS